MPQLKYCRSYSRECGKRSAQGGSKGGGATGRATETGRPTAGGGRFRGLEAGLILNMMISRIRRRSGLPLPPSYSPPTVRTTHSPSFSLSFCRHAARRRAHPKHTRAHTRASTRRVHARVPHALLTSRRGRGTCAVPHRGLMYCTVFPPSLAFTANALSPSLSSVSVERGTRRDVTCAFTLFVIFFLSFSVSLFACP